MKETRFGDKSGAHSEKISLASEIFARLAMKITVASKIFLIFFLKNKIK